MNGGAESTEHLPSQSLFVDGRDCSSRQVARAPSGGSQSQGQGSWQSTGHEIGWARRPADTQTGRHRRGGAGSWTPAVPPTRPAGRHGSTQPADPPTSGSLPILSDPVFPPARGELSVPSQPQPRRAKVTLTPPACRDEEAEDDIRVYLAEPTTGLGTFDLGTVPASVTPPRSWRRAAWFATVSSGGVVVALLFAGSALVGKPAPDQASGGWIPGPGGGLPTAGGERTVPSPGGAPRATSEGVLNPSGPVLDSPAAGQTTVSQVPGPRSPGGTSGTRVPASGSSSAPRSTQPVLHKPPSTPAPYDSAPFRFSWPAGDPAVLARDSQNFLDRVTENPQAAYAMTTGALARAGAQGLARRYADIAFFEVRHVHVNQYDGKTVCKVRTVHKDGRETTEERTLLFDDGKIAGDGQ
jgi:hypothetical protein